MKKGFRINLRAGEKIYINGAVLCVDRKVSLEFLNDVAFLLESHVLSPDETTTPLRQLYYMIQTMLIEPGSAAAARGMFDATLPQLLATFNNRQVLEGLGGVQRDQSQEAGKKAEQIAHGTGHERRAAGEISEEGFVLAGTRGEKEPRNAREGEISARTCARNGSLFQKRRSTPCRR